jgi:hypothetical protein
MSALSSIGITHSMLLLGILFVITAVILGMYWHIIVPGAVMITVAMLFVPPVTTAANTPTKVEAVDEDKMAFMEDCKLIAEYTESECARLWNERLQAEKELAEEPTMVDVKYRPKAHHVKYH